MRRSFILLVLMGCGEEAVQRAWDEYVSDNNACEVDEDCGVVYPGCPLGCATAVRADVLDDARDRAEELIRRYERFGRSCIYDCLGDLGATCDGGVCEVVPAAYPEG